MSRLALPLIELGWLTVATIGTEWAYILAAAGFILTPAIYLEMRTP